MSKTAENPNIRISPHSKATLRELAEHDGRPMQNVLDEAIEQYRRDRFFREVDEGYARLQADPKAWQEELDERVFGTPPWLMGSTANDCIHP